MKKLSIFLLAIVAILSLSSCSEDDDFTFVAKQSPEGVMFLNAPAPQYSLSASNGDNIAERFVWNEVDFDVQTTVRYELQASTTETFDENMTILASDIAETNYAVTVKSMLELAKEAGLDNDPETEDAPNTGMLYFKVRAYVGDTAPSNVEEISEVLGLMVVLPETEGAEPAKLQLYMVGDASLDVWNPNNNNTPLFRDAADENIFYYTGYFKAGSFKFITTLGSWAPMYGVNPDAEGTLIARPTEADPDPSTIDVADAGYYSLLVNLNDLTYTFEPYDASSAATYTTIGLIGDSTPDAWDADQDMTQLSNDSHIWYISEVELTDGEAKFRAENGWDINWGADTPLSGEATSGGPNIPVTAGIYNVWFNDLTGRYVFIPQVQE
ncbi:SusF/SusE family outer membrane protein [Salinimicrobium gaetbulicola]|uniref:SusF/SusE family outer membrane protein n=1 Tax=Salinimicrobium gaetbulicola TaxID=999702 RepID=A0ABW3ICL5_9FLAO